MAREARWEENGIGDLPGTGLVGGELFGGEEREPAEPVEADPEEADPSGTMFTFDGADPRMWDTFSIKEACIVIIPVTSDAGEDGDVAAYVKEVSLGPHGCWLSLRSLGGSYPWARDLGTRWFSRSRLRLHLCKHGESKCTVAHLKGRHTSVVRCLPPGHPPPNYVEKGMRREWEKLYKVSTGAVKQETPVATAPVGGAPDRIAALRSRLQDRRSGSRATPQPALPWDAGVTTIASGSEDDRAQRARDKRQSMSEALAQAAVRSGGLGSQPKKKSSKKRSKRSRSRRRRRRSDSRDSASASSRSSSVSSLVPPLQRRSQRSPGSVFSMLLKDVSQALAEAAVPGDADLSRLGGAGNKMAAYYQLCAKPQLGGKIRDARELETLAHCMDLLKAGQLALLGDTLAGRFLGTAPGSATGEAHRTHKPRGPPESSAAYSTSRKSSRAPQLAAWRWQLSTKWIRATARPGRDRGRKRKRKRKVSASEEKRQRKRKRSLERLEAARKDGKQATPGHSQVRKLKPGTFEKTPGLPCASCAGPGPTCESAQPTASISADTSHLEGVPARTVDPAGGRTETKISDDCLAASGGLINEEWCTFESPADFASQLVEGIRDGPTRGNG